MAVYVVEYFAHGWRFYCLCESEDAIATAESELAVKWPGHDVRHTLTKVRK